MRVWGVIEFLILFLRPCLSSKQVAPKASWQSLISLSLLPSCHCSPQPNPSIPDHNHKTWQNTPGGRSCWTTPDTQIASKHRATMVFKKCTFLPSKQAHAPSPLEQIFCLPFFLPGLGWPDWRWQGKVLIFFLSRQPLNCLGSWLFCWAQLII